MSATASAAAQDLVGFVRQVARCSARDAGFVLGVAGLQVGLLGQVQASPPGSVAGRGRAGTRRPAHRGGPRCARRRVDQRCVRRGSTPTISRTGRLPRSGARPFGEPHPEAVAQLGFQGGVVGLRRGDDGLEQHPPVDRQPPPVEGLDLVGHRDVGVQVRVAGPAVAVGERRRDQPRTSTCRTPFGPVRVNRACVSMNRSASATAAWCARSIAAATSGRRSPTAPTPT